VSKGIIPFSNGSSFMDWQCLNCDSCKKFNEDDPEKSCEIDYALAIGSIGDGTISEDIAKRMGFSEGYAPRVCGEFENRW